MVFVLVYFFFLMLDSQLWCEKEEPQGFTKKTFENRERDGNDETK